MANPATLSLQSIIDIQAYISPMAAVRNSFNQGLILGTSARIPSYSGDSPRIRQYNSGTWSASMIADGFLKTDPEYIAVELYFSQNPQAVYVWVGRQDLTAIASSEGSVIPHAGNAGLNYVVGDVVGITKADASNGYARVETIGAGGAVTGLSVSPGQGGTGYAISNTLATTGGSGDGNLKVDITAINESPLDALTVCRAVNYEWYACYSCAAVKADHEAITAWVQTQMSNSGIASTVYFFDDGTSDSLGGVADNVFSHIKALSYNRAAGLYGTTQSAVYPNNAYMGAAMMGVAMGLNTGLANSAFTMKFKQLVGVAAEPLTQTQVNMLEGNNANCYLNYGNYYNILEQGVMCNGQFIDEIINLDMLVNNIQLSVMDLLYGSVKVPQTDSGVTQIINKINQACEQAVNIGFLAPGKWTGSAILNLNPGDMLAKGYLVQAAPISAQSDADRQARKSPSIYVAIKEAGAVHSVLIGVYINR